MSVIFLQSQSQFYINSERIQSLSCRNTADDGGDLLRVRIATAFNLRKTLNAPKTLTALIRESLLFDMESLVE
jgi:hypothetical protein